MEVSQLVLFLTGLVKPTNMVCGDPHSKNLEAMAVSMFCSLHYFSFFIPSHFHHWHIFLCRVLFFYSIPFRGTEYCNEHVCLYMCLSTSISPELHICLVFTNCCACYLQGWQVSAIGGLNHSLNYPGRNRFLASFELQLPVSGFCWQKHMV